MIEDADDTSIGLANPWGIDNAAGTPFEVEVNAADYAKDFMDAAFIQP